MNKTYKNPMAVVGMVAVGVAAILAVWWAMGGLKGNMGRGGVKVAGEPAAMPTIRPGADTQELMKALDATADDGGEADLMQLKNDASGL